MTDKKQPEALRIASSLELCWGDSRIDAAAAELRRLHAENETLRTGYEAARLEIESLKAQSAAQQPGAAYAALPDADRDYMRKVVAVAVTVLFDGYKEDVMRVFSTGELSEIVRITAPLRPQQVEDIYRRAWDLLSLPVRASHGQAPAGAVERGDLSAPCPHCHAGPYYLCGHYQTPVARQAPSALEDAARWGVLDGGGAQVTNAASLSEAMAYLTPERLSRQWCAVCVVDQSNLPLAALAQPAAPAGEDAKERAKP